MHSLLSLKMDIAEMSFSIKFFPDVKFGIIIESMEGRIFFNANQFSEIRFLTYSKNILLRSFYPPLFVTGVQKQSLQSFIPKFGTKNFFWFQICAPFSVRFYSYFKSILRCVFCSSVFLSPEFTLPSWSLLYLYKVVTFQWLKLKFYKILGQF